MAGFSSTAYLQIASALGVRAGGVLADRLVRRTPSERMLTEALGLFLGVPFILLTGLTTRVATVVGAMAGFGLFKGVYDANTSLSPAGAARNWRWPDEFVRPARRGIGVPARRCHKRPHRYEPLNCPRPAAVYPLVSPGLVAGVRRWMARAQA